MQVFTGGTHSFTGSTHSFTGSTPSFTGSTHSFTGSTPWLTPHLLVVSAEELWAAQQHLPCWLILSGCIVVHLCERVKK
jgi:hypothetical protein